MGQQVSKDELLYQQVEYGNVDGIKSLHQQGASLEAIDKEGKTPLMVACLKPNHLDVVKTLLDLGANINAYRPGFHGGTPLHHAAKRGFEDTVSLLLSRNANAVVMNDDCQTPLDMARAKGHDKVVRIIENYICLFSGWLRQFYGPAFLEVLAPQWVSRKVWAVVIPCNSPSRNNSKPPKFELAIYQGLQDAQPLSVIALWKAIIEEPKISMPDPALIIFDKASKTKFKFLSVNEGDQYQIQRLYDACKGIPQQNIPTCPIPSSVPTPIQGDTELSMAIHSSLHLVDERPPVLPSNTTDWEISRNHTAQNGWSSQASSLQPTNPGSSGWTDEPSSHDGDYKGWYVSHPESSNKQHPIQKSETNPVPLSSQVKISTTTIPPATLAPAIPLATPIPSAPAIPSAPPIPETIVDDHRICYPSIDLGPIDSPVPTTETDYPIICENSKGISASCVICLDGPVEAACIPCGHMAGCMSCLKEIKNKSWGCPVCRAKIDQVTKIYYAV